MHNHEILIEYRESFKIIDSKNELKYENHDDICLFAMYKYRDERKKEMACMYDNMTKMIKMKKLRMNVGETKGSRCWGFEK